MSDIVLMKVDEITGPVGVAPYTGWLELVIFSPVLGGSKITGPRGMGEAHREDHSAETNQAHVWRKKDRASPLLSQLSSSGQLTKITIARAASEAGIFREKWRVTYKDAVIAVYDQNENGPGNLPLEHLALVAAEMEIDSSEGCKILPAVCTNQSKPESLADWFTKVMPFPSSSRL